MSQRPHQHEHLAAYFCMEFALHEEFPIYSGGLGVLAGDAIKSAGDLKLPLVAVGLFWNEGYTTQRIDADGRPYDEYPPCPAEHTRDTGVRISVEVAGEEVRCRVLLVDKYGNAPLYLLDPEAPAQRWITRRLYGGGARDRVAQEILLGVGGVRALRALGLPVTVYHFNEGHAVFAGLELMREHMQSASAPLDFEAALEATRAVCVFTTHTPVPAGNETHPGELLLELGANLHLTAAELETLGGEPFGMTVAGLRLSRRANAVAALHGDTSRGMWKAVTGAAPITSITNGVHPGTWQDERIRGAMRGEDSMWDAHHALKRALVHEVWRRTGTRLDSGKLLIGFARRAAAYKRADLILRNSARIEQRLLSGDVQLLFSGKAHPKDDAGKEIVANLVAMARRYPGSVVFLENYDMSIGRLLTRGCDVWLNNPRRPLEASGTSGMKAAMNGVLNLSVLDGWWPEGCAHGVNGWQIGGGYEPEGQTPAEHEAQDQHDMQALYDVLDREVVPTFYADRARWIAMMRASVEMAEVRFSSHRMVQQYFTELYRMDAELRPTVSVDAPAPGMVVRGGAEGEETRAL
ncbi:MAG: alpha-glucan family phosphorylase [Deltaproteobacteria bacterium]|nr:alpha-glucan family phosphorylase [Deltaproteobacteria bacterium]